MKATGPDLVIHCRRHAVSPCVAVRVWIPGGVLAEPAPGVALATGRLLVEGTRSRSWDQLARESEALGMDLGGFGGGECTGVSVDALSADWRRALALAAEAVNEPTFPEERCAWIRRQTLAELESLGEQPEIRTGWGFLAQLYGPHPWGRPVQGDRSTLERLEPRICGDFHASALAGGLIVSVSGDVDEEEVRSFAEELFSSPGAAPERPVAGVDPESAPGVREVELDRSEQVQVLVGHLTVPVADPDFPALELASVALGSGPGLEGRIPERIREREGLAYAVSAALAAGAGTQPGRMVVHAATAPDRVEALLSAVRQELERLVEEGLSAQEVEEARRYLLGSDALRRETARQVAVLQAQAALYGMPLDDPEWLVRTLEGLDAPAVNESLRRHVDPAKLCVTLGVPARP